MDNHWHIEPMDTSVHYFIAILSVPRAFLAPLFLLPLFAAILFLFEFGAGKRLENTAVAGR